MPAFAPAKIRALSVGLPLNLHKGSNCSGFSINASLHKTAISKVLFLSELFISLTSIFPSVKVRVLSVQIIEVLPNVSAEANFLTNPFFFKILCMPRARITVIATGNPSGTAATATAIAIIKISLNSTPVIMPSKRIIRQTIVIIRLIILEKRLIFF